MGDDSSAVADVPAEFARRRRRQFLVTIPLFVVGVIAGVRVSDDPKSVNPVAVAIFVVAMGSAVAFSLVNWRCPSCRGYLRKATNPKFCPNCGIALRSPAGS